jgi:Ala-tRNA(Pro) deacylase
MGIRDYLQSRHVRFQTLLHRPVPSATRFAQSVHVPGRSVAKAVLVHAGEGYVLTVLPATHRVDPDRLAEILGVSRVQIASEDEVERVFADCERGALPPFGRLYGLTTVVDASLAGVSEIVFLGNSRHEGVRMSYRDYEAVEGPIRARFAFAIAPRRRRSSHRRAG